MIDSLQKFSDAQAVTVTAASTNVLDMLALRDEGVGNALELNVYVGTAFTAAGAATMQTAFQASADNITFYDILLTAVIGKAALTAGAHILAVPMPRLYQPLMQAVGLPRYIRLNFTVATGPMTAGTINAWLGAAMDRQAAYPHYNNNYVTP